MTALLIVIYIAFVSLGVPDSLFGVTWPVVHVEFGLPESFGSVYSVVTAVSTGGTAFIADPLLRKFGTGRDTFFSTLLTAFGLGVIGATVITLRKLKAVEAERRDEV